MLEYKSFRTSTELVAVGREVVTAQPDGLAGGLRMKQPRRESDDGANNSIDGESLFAIT